MCGNSYKRRSFRPSKSPLYAANNGLLPVCSNCLDKDFKDCIEKLKDEEIAFRRLCLHWNIYFSSDLFKKIRASRDIDKVIGGYFSQMNFPQWGENKTYDDTIDEEANGVIETLEEFKENDKINKLPQRVFKDWGGDYEPDEYIILENKFNGWVSQVKTKGKLTNSLEENIREMCKIAIDIRRARKTPGTKPSDLARLQEVQLKYMESAGLKPIQEDVSTNLIENIGIGVLTKHWEKDEPVPDYPEANLIKEICDVYYKGHLARTAELPNDTLNEYKKEMEKYNLEMNSEDDEEITEIVEESHE